MWKPQRLIALWASTACYKDSSLALSLAKSEYLLICGPHVGSNIEKEMIMLYEN
jgi:hypothetical protein